MFNSILSAFRSPKPEPLTADNVSLVLSAILVRVAKSDRLYAFEEIEEIDEILAQRFDLNPVQAAKLRAEAEAFEETAPDTIEFSEALKKTVEYSERSGIVEAVWKVVMADGIERPEEHDILVAIAQALGVSIADLDATS